jgi:hypothetical protein
VAVSIVDGSDAFDRPAFMDQDGLDNARRDSHSGHCGSGRRSEIANRTWLGRRGAVAPRFRHRGVDVSSAFGKPPTAVCPVVLQ